MLLSNDAKLTKLSPHCDTLKNHAHTRASSITFIFHYPIEANKYSKMMNCDFRIYSDIIRTHMRAKAHSVPFFCCSTVVATTRCDDFYFYLHKPKTILARWKETDRTTTTLVPLIFYSLVFIENWLIVNIEIVVHRIVDSAPCAFRT